jgi:hypothetical protein
MRGWMARPFGSGTLRPWFCTATPGAASLTLSLLSGLETGTGSSPPTPPASYVDEDEDSQPLFIVERGTGKTFSQPPPGRSPGRRRRAPGPVPPAGSSGRCEERGTIFVAEGERTIDSMNSVIRLPSFWTAMYWALALLV